MQNESLTELVRHHLETARTASSGRSAQTLFGGHDNVLRQTLIALRAGSTLDEHENPGEATVQVLHGHVTPRGRGLLVERVNGRPDGGARRQARPRGPRGLRDPPERRQEERLTPTHFSAYRHARRRQAA